MMAAMMTVVNPGDKVAIFSPFYENYTADTILTGAEPVYIPLVPPTFSFDANLIEEAFKQGAKALVLCNPSNPCGKVFTREDVNHLIRFHFAKRDETLLAALDRLSEMDSKAKNYR